MDTSNNFTHCSYVDVEGKQLVAADDANSNFELGSGGSELVITNKNEKGTRVRTLGSREFIRYYRQKPRPSVATDRALALSLASRYKSLCCSLAHFNDDLMLFHS